ncbi:Cathepsin C [Babesia duncani]|uniref:Cathepsin C n=1 Tax=Babesia duncani TaxID=323732 RepID=A0AAD9UQF4_9APIC|nr:Cathepsin C [Babesia duncani]
MHLVPGLVNIIACHFLCLHVWVSFVFGDLPIHALTSDVIGHWRIWETLQLFEAPQACGGTIPNSNWDNLKLSDYKSYLNDTYGNLVETLVILSNERLHKREEIPPRNQWKFLRVKNGKDGSVIGNWYCFN